MTIRTTLASGSGWTNIGNGPATVQVISPQSGITVEVISVTAQPTGDDGLAMGAQLPVQHFSRTQTLWAQVLPGAGGAASSAIVAVQPEAT